ncbi:PspC domain-containing protein [Streptomyces sp. M10(2022)]
MGPTRTYGPSPWSNDRSPGRRSRRHAAPAETAAAAQPAAESRGRVCGGLGRYCDVDPVIFRIVIGVLAATGGIGLIFYGFAWLLLPPEGEEENEARKLLSGRVEGASLIALLMALVGCGLLLSMLHNSGMLAFAAMLSLAVVGFTVWTQHRGTAAPDEPRDVAASQSPAGSTPAGGHGAPPEVKAPPTRDTPSWWRDPSSRTAQRARSRPATCGVPAVRPTTPGDGRDPHDGPARAHGGRRVPHAAPCSGDPGPRRIGGLVFLLALIAGSLGTKLDWETQPLGSSLQTG